MNQYEMFSRDDKTTLREWYQNGVAYAIWADDEDERHLAGLMEVARCAAVVGYEGANLELEWKGRKRD